VSVPAWRILNEEKYFTATKGGDELQARNLILQNINAVLADEFGLRTIKEVVSGERQEVMDILSEKVNDKVRKYGMEIVDVRIKRIDLPEDVSGAVFDRMRSERDRVAKELRSQGAEAAERIRAEADRQRTEILADAYRQAQTIRGEGDAISAETYARAYGRDEEFFRFYRSMEAYRKTFQGQGDVMVLEPDSDFFRYFNGPLGKGAK